MNPMPIPPLGGVRRLVSAYDAKGEILHQADFNEYNYARHAEAGLMMVEGHFDKALYWVSGGAAVLREASPAIFEELSLRNLPVPCKIIINGVSYDCNDARATLDFTYPNTYQIKVVAWPYLNAEFEVTI